MKKLVWKPEYSVGHPGIDADHQGLFALVQELHEADMTDGLLSNILRRLEDYAEGHFAREEEMMRQGGYPDLEEHKTLHRNFEEWLNTVKKTYRRAAESPFQVGDSVNAFLENWLVAHIMEEDMLYRDYISNKIQDH
ncbi:bacteriohemerythrin [Magnetospira sp. QH-2]|uniref:bacteriohemerythrin n=1 Tax=Magnetospira sp. (strain QH-2) TaxID=1288970 RepID=UPI0003E80C1D|nr:bacteriohemerythrin [Magnetospira sp. QH-2]CCQ74528.1 putative Hemerythrin-like metal-binding protein [Magnetospira sp. QH-2]